MIPIDPISAFIGFLAILSALSVLVALIRWVVKLFKKDRGDIKNKRKGKKKHGK